MYPLFETIRYKNGVAENLPLHQQRVDNTLMLLRANKSIDLFEQINKHLSKPIMDDKVYKCRLSYNLFGEVHIQFEPYQIKNIQTICLQDIGQNDYPYKYADRDWIKAIVAKTGTDEVILTQKGFIKDASYANLVFFNGVKWVTPKQPLLLGTRRAGLLNAGIISEARITTNDLNNFTAVKLINAMMLWEESPMITMEQLIKHL